MRYAGLGIQLAVALLLGVLGGQWLDRKIGTDAVFTTLGAFVALGATLYWVIRELNRSNGGGT